ncbi:MAG: putative peptidoglycan glycosyltransferase FtsW [bacterium]
MKEKKVDKFFLTIVILLLVLGVAMFISASLGFLARNEKIFYNILFTQLVLGFGLGTLGMYFSYRINYKFWRKYSLYLFLASIAITALVFVPGLGWSHGGAERWIKIPFLGTFQPAELLKFGFIIYFAAWLSWAKNKVKDFKFSILPLVIMIGIIAFVLLKQPDTKSLILIIVTALAMIFFAEVPVKYIFILIFGSAILFAGLVFYTPYLQDRVKTFMDPSSDPRGSSYQIQQSLIAIGSGGVLGRGYGQSVQKFSYLPEPQGDSIFAVLAEELGLIGTIFTVLLYSFFALRGLRIANRSPDLFSRLLVCGIVILITAQSFMNIASTTGVIPLTGVPLVFMSQGGTSLMIYLIALGIVLQISKYQKKVE